MLDFLLVWVEFVPLKVYHLLKKQDRDIKPKTRKKCFK